MRYAVFFGIQNIKKDKKRVFSTIISVLISTAFITALIGFGFSLKSMLYRDACRNYGSYDICINNEQYDILDNLGVVETLGTKAGPYTANIEAYNLELYYYNTEGIELESVKLESGSLPQNENEVAVSTQIKIGDNYISDVYEIGDEIMLNTSDGEKNFYLSGIIDDFDAGKSIEEDSFTAISINNSISQDNITCYALVKRSGFEDNIKIIAEAIGLSEEEIYNISTSTIEDEQGVFINDPVTSYYKFSLLSDTNSELVRAIIYFALIIIFISVLLLGSRMLLSVDRRKKEIAVLKMLAPETDILY